MKNYKEMESLLTGRNSKRRKVANNTYLERRNENAIALRLHQTDILIFNKSGTITVTSGGWKTSTTKARLNDYLPHGFGVYANKGIWRWTQRNGTFKPLAIFTDGDQITRNGTLKSKAKPCDEKAQLAFRKRVNKFAQLCADACPLPEPGNGDCWYCRMQTQGKSLGDSCKNLDHLESHVQEGYAVPSLVYNALQERGYGPLILSMAFGKCAGLSCGIRNIVKRSVARYIFKRFAMMYK